MARVFITKASSFEYCRLARSQEIENLDALLSIDPKCPVVVNRITDTFLMYCPIVAEGVAAVAGDIEIRIYDDYIE